ncbi:hypothetical protein ACSHWO_27960 [Streptomyces sp. HUAS TT3]|uniref:hypothetical protein n=1 Tax=Streptomyces sp. HUAS TT3 TaxID=3447510 RepID=UPI003F656B21
MTSFATHRRRVHNVSRPPRRRLSALWTCLTEFAPYGFRATYHHLTVSAGIPARLEDDPGALVWAVEELHAARELWRAEYAAWQVRRTVQKASGVRVPNPPEPARRLWCPDPEFHPDEPLHVVMARILRTASGAPEGCPVCGTDRGTRVLRDGHHRHRLCAGCGVSLGATPTARDGAVLAARAEHWRLVWRRSAPPRDPVAGAAPHAAGAPGH